MVFAKRISYDYSHDYTHNKSDNAVKYGEKELELNN